ncbi:MAG: 16S rRNA (adenine(1518)-N(6)/adenine(1519)-N(6))-dimethyltransferase RsmA [bacterium]
MSAPFYPRPRKALGQHFLTDPRILGRIADALSAAPGDTVVEIGPGRGALTDILLARTLRVVAIEVDRDLAPMLVERHAGNPALTVIAQDVLEVNLAEAAGVAPFLVVGNVPYNITTPILFHALQRPRAARAVYLVQKEVAERVVAKAGDESYGALTANVQVVAKAEMLFTVPAGAFIPPPKVESAVLRLTPLEQPLIAADEEAPYRLMVQGAFGMRRKQMLRVVRELWSLDPLAAGALLETAGITPTDRPEVLSPDDFARLLRARLQASRLTSA